MGGRADEVLGVEDVAEENEMGSEFLMLPRNPRDFFESDEEVEVDVDGEVKVLDLVSLDDEGEEAVADAFVLLVGNSQEVSSVSGFQ